MAITDSACCAVVVNPEPHREWTPERSPSIAAMPSVSAARSSAAGRITGSAMFTEDHDGSDGGSRVSTDEESGGSMSSNTAPASSGPGLRQLLIAALPPTLALVGVALGIWVGVRQDAIDRERADRVRVAELVLPSYQEVVDSAVAVEFAIDRCLVWLSIYGEEEVGSPEEADALTKTLDFCDRIPQRSAEVDSAIAKALLVSDDRLQSTAQEYLETKDETQEAVAGVLQATTVRQAQRGMSDIFQLFEQLEDASNDLIDAVNDQTLIEGTEGDG